MNDVINRKDAIGAVLSVGHIAELSDGDAVVSVSAVNYVLRNLPSAQPERKKGKWIAKPDPYEFFDEIPVCSECGCTTKTRERTRYCPFCGADMRGDNNG